jgi:4-alpha-glucanotransferase
MQFPSFTHPVTGVAVPVGALKTGHSCGTGEFLDLIPFADFCKKSSIDLIQLLPVNDTGTESSPYSALSAFALHPVYIRLQEIPEAASFAKDIATLKEKYEILPRFNYREIRDEKLALLHRIYDVNEKNIIDSPALAKWIDANPWIVEYAVFMNLKRRNFDASWKSWDKLQTPTHTEIRTRWESPQKRAEHLFFAWVQMRLDEQFSEAVAYCAKQGIAVKGDIPIMMNEDSCDAWANPEFFRDDLRAGSPPDGPNPTGQNWGFPIYNWDNLREDGYSWWKKRLAHSAKYYHAYRIDHILGFFRIWSIPYGEGAGYLGWTTPHAPITAAELAELGFTGDRLRWICEPHVPTRVVEEVNNFDYLGTHGIMRTLMNRIGNEELWLFKSEVRHENDIWNAPIPEPAKQVLARAWRNRLMQITGRDDKGKPLYSPIWMFRETTAWASLSAEEKSALDRLIAEKGHINERLWKDQAEELLGTLTAGVDMLACAEDLGTIPESVPEVLGKLGILGLKVIRWERRWSEYGQPFKDIGSYPALSVATTSVHDSSTLRGWWEQEHGAADFLACWNAESAGLPAGSSDSFRAAYTPETAAFVLKTMARTSSSLFVLPIQDFLALSPDFYKMSADEERVNIPGSVSTFNWTYRIPTTIEQLAKNKKLISAIADVLKERRGKQADPAMKASKK